MDAVAEATSRADLCDRLLGALAREFGWTGASLAEDETAAGRAGGPWIRVAAGPAARVVIGVPLAGGRRPDARERSICARLGRPLAPALRALAPAGRPRPGDQWSLTEREREVAGLVAAGMTNRQVAERLHVTVDTVKKHIANVLRKTGCTSRTRLAVLWQT
jgi:DNA-binding CsgD family transcriptional regulator